MFLYGIDFATVGFTKIPKESQSYQEIVEGPKPYIYCKALLKDGVPVGMFSLGERKDALAFKRAIDHRVNLTPVASRLFANDFKLVVEANNRGQSVVATHHNAKVAHGITELAKALTDVLPAPPPRPVLA